MLPAGMKNILTNKEYRAVTNRVLVSLDDLKIATNGGGSQEKITEVLSEKGIVPITVDICDEAKKLIGKEFRRGALPSEAPDTLDCSSLIKYIFGLAGVWLPRLSIQQFNHPDGEEVQLKDIHPGDIIYRKGRINRFDDDGREVGHSGLYIGNGYVIEAKNKAAGIIETSLEEFCADNVVTGVRRFIPLDSATVTLEFPETICIETSDDVRWIVLQGLHRQ